MCVAAGGQRNRRGIQQHSSADGVVSLPASIRMCLLVSPPAPPPFLPPSPPPPSVYDTILWHGDKNATELPPLPLLPD